MNIFIQLPHERIDISRWMTDLFIMLMRRHIQRNKEPLFNSKESQNQNLLEILIILEWRQLLNNLTVRWKYSPTFFSELNEYDKIINLKKKWIKKNFVVFSFFFLFFFFFFFFLFFFLSFFFFKWKLFRPTNFTKLEKKRDICFRIPNHPNPATRNLKWYAYRVNPRG